VRAALLAIAVAAAAWFALAAQQSVDTSRATALVSGSTHLSASQVAHAKNLLSAAGFLNPDRQVDVVRAQLDRERGNLSAARTILKRVVAAEPDNLQAWVELAQASVGDLKDFYAAAYRVRQLVPPVPPPR
jgi:predicted Zn-dependent protease